MSFGVGFLAIRAIDKDKSQGLLMVTVLGGLAEFRALAHAAARKSPKDHHVP
jgi:hypothetical protein